MLRKLFKKLGGRSTTAKRAAPIGMASKKGGRSASDRAKLRKSGKCEFC